MSVTTPAISWRRGGRRGSEEGKGAVVREGREDAGEGGEG